MSDKSAVEIVNEAERLARKTMAPQMRVWREAEDAFHNRRAIDDPYRLNVTIGTLMSDLETVIPRDAQALLGSRPYMPIRANVAAEQPRAQAIEDLADHYANRQFFLAFSDALRMARGLGIGYIEPRWDFWPVNIFDQHVVRDKFGRVVSLSQYREETIEEGLGFHVHHPLSVRVHPFGNNLDEKPWVIIVEWVDIEHVQRLLDAGTYKLDRGVTFEDLKRAEPDRSDWLLDQQHDRQGIAQDLRGRVGLLMRYYSADRWIVTWNRAIKLMDTENQNRNMPRSQKPVVALRNVTHIGPERYWPIGMYEMGRDLAERADDALSLYFDGAYMGRAQWMLYNSDILNEEDLVAESGARIPVPGGRFDQAVYPLKVGSPPRELFDVHKIAMAARDRRLGLYDYQRGSETVRKETATTTQILSQAGNTRLEYGILYIEQTAMQRLAYLTTKLIAANITDGDAQRILGFERMRMMGSPDPDSLRGGFTFHFEGSARIQRKAQKLETLIQGYNMTRQSPTVLEPWIMDRKLLEKMEAFTSEELDQMGLTQNAQDQAKQAAGATGAPAPGQLPVRPVSQGQAVENPNAIATPMLNLERGGARR